MSAVGISEGITFPLFIAFLFAWVASFYVIRPVLSFPQALFVAGIRVGVPFVYFAFLNKGWWYMVDDLHYVDSATTLRELGYGPLGCVLSPLSSEPVSMYVGSEHTLYYCWNILAFSLFGEHYFSAVFLNIALTFAAARMMVALLELSGYGRTYSRLFALFFLLHWDIVAWSSFVNLKDVLVLTLTIAAVTLTVSLCRTFSWVRAVLLLATVALFFQLRFYVPVFLLVSGMLWILTTKRELLVKAGLVLVPLIALLLFLLPWEQDFSDYFVIQDVPFGALRFSLMPQFWTVVEPFESFLEIPSFFHWLFFVPMLIGLTALWRRSPALRFPIIYAIIIVMFYAYVPDLQGPRQRFQLTFVIALGQFHALYAAVAQTARTWRELPLLRFPSAPTVE